MSAIVVCPLSRLADTVAAYRATHIVTLVNDGTLFARPPVVPAANHLHVAVHDIIEPLNGMVCPTEEHVGSYLGFIRRWDRQAPIVVHCFAGISRSTAAAFSAFCAERPDLDEEEIALRLRRRSPEATPNARLVAIADEMLGRSGRMVRAIERIGRGVEAYEGSVFALRLDE
jgi:predicted protein tyrosine phosphatase